MNAFNLYLTKEGFTIFFIKIELVWLRYINTPYHIGKALFIFRKIFPFSNFKKHMMRSRDQLQFERRKLKKISILSLSKKRRTTRIKASLFLILLFSKDTIFFPSETKISEFMNFICTLNLNIYILNRYYWWIKARTWG